MKKAPELSSAQKSALGEMNTISDKIRYLDTQGYSRADIARILKRRYQHVRNVLVHSKQSGEGLTKTSFTLKAAGIEALNSYMEALGRSRDPYLSELLEMAVGFLKDRDANSSETEQLLREMYRPDVEYQLEAGDLTRVNLALGEQTVSRINELCKEKRIPRDILVDTVIGSINDYVSRAVELINDPFQAAAAEAVDPFESCVLSTEQTEEVRRKWHDEVNLITAVARLKGASYEATRIAYQGLTAAERARLRQNSDVQAELARIENEDAESIDLDDLLD